MPEYRRLRVAGATYFFTVATNGRRPILTEPGAAALLGRVFRAVRSSQPFATNAIVLLPDHFHLLMTLPDGDDDFPTRMNQIKRQFTIGFGGQRSSEPGQRDKRLADVWQPRFWEHLVRDQNEWEALADYIHFNPVRHGHSRCPHEWRWSSFHRYVRRGWLEPDWSCACRGKVKVPYAESLVELCGEPDGG